MSKMVWDVTMSLDGFTAGPNVRAEEPMGDGGEKLHAWMEGTGPDGQADLAVFDKVNARVGATIVGRRTFDLGLKNWGGTPWPGTPSFVVTHRPHEAFKGDNGGTFAFGGLEDMARRAREAAGDKNVLVLGADVARQLLRAGHLDELWLHISPILLGGGTPMFAGERAELVPLDKALMGTAAHHFFRVDMG
ncbi:MAG TPA: dihydrofolate reductase family protein, partial [Devosia sp.]